MGSLPPSSGPQGLDYKTQRVLYSTASNLYLCIQAPDGLFVCHDMLWAATEWCWVVYATDPEGEGESGTSVREGVNHQSARRGGQPDREIRLMSDLPRSDEARSDER